jgi:uncharacterized protein
MLGRFMHLRREELLLQKMKKVYLIHAWGMDSNEAWYPWLKKELEKKKIKVYAFDMLNTNNPKIESWVKYMEENIKEVDEETYFVGHSIGCQTIMRYLEKLPKHKEIGGCVFVAGWFNLDNLGKEEIIIAHPWVNTKINFDRIRRHMERSLCIFSDNDPYVSLSESKIFKDELGAKIIIKKGMRHFDEVEKIEEVLNFLLK